MVHRSCVKKKNCRNIRSVHFTEFLRLCQQMRLKREGDKTIYFIVSDGGKYRMQGGHVAAHWFAVYWSLYFNTTTMYT